MYTFPQQDDKCNGTRFNSNSSNLNKRMALTERHTHTHYYSYYRFLLLCIKKSEQANNEYWHAVLFFYLQRTAAGFQYVW